MKKINYNELENELDTRIANKIEGGVYLIHNELLVILSKILDANLNYIKQSNYNVWNSRNFGGTIVAFPNDIDIGILKKDGFDLGKNILIFLKEKLSKYIVNLEIIGNDLLVDNKYKVVSFASTNAGDNYIYTVVHISLNPNVEIISKVCTKEMKKIPKGLSDYGLTTELIEEILQELEI